jgi:hypothetical protein
MGPSASSTSSTTAAKSTLGVCVLVEYLYVGQIKVDRQFDNVLQDTDDQHARRKVSSDGENILEYELAEDSTARISSAFEGKVGIHLILQDNGGLGVAKSSPLHLRIHL